MGDVVEHIFVKLFDTGIYRATCSECQCKKLCRKFTTKRAYWVCGACLKHAAMELDYAAAQGIGFKK